MSFPDSPGEGWIRNDGNPPSCVRVLVLLRNGNRPYDVTETRPDCKPGWAVETSRWSLTGDPFDIAWYKPC